MNGLPLQALFMLWIICTSDGAPYSSESQCFHLVFDDGELANVWDVKKKAPRVQVNRGN